MKQPLHQVLLVNRLFCYNSVITYLAETPEMTHSVRNKHTGRLTPGEPGAGRLSIIGEQSSW